MLKHLSIRNYILIRKLEMDFYPGFSVITGETGAGKSIFLGALGLLLGDRADTSAVSDNAEKCIIEGTFDIQHSVDSSFFDENDLDYEALCVIRKEITSQGKSRAFINDTPVNLSILKSLSEKLIDVHSQHTTILLAKNSFHLTLLDAVAGTSGEFKTYHTLWNEHKKILAQIGQLSQASADIEKEKDYFSFLVNEIDTIQPGLTEKEDLEQELLILQNAEKIKAVLLETSSAMKFSEQSIHEQLSRVQHLLENIASNIPSVEELSVRLKSAGIEIDDIASELSALESKISHDPDRIIKAEERLDTIQTLFHKHRVQSTEELFSLRKTYSEKITGAEDHHEQLEKMRRIADEQLDDLRKRADYISQKRGAIIKELEGEITGILSALAMPSARFSVDLNRNEELSAKGYDDVAFLFSANKGESVQELSKVASGGEMSRLMLALKSVIARTSNLPVLIFDEIDTGISGETAKKMASIFSEMGKTIQLIVITHLPQIAGRADKHLRVSKQETEKETFTVMHHLDEDERIHEIATMLGGDNFTATALQTAREIIQKN
jgi:DNA repair protein RecN (Recombination protein N)